MAIEKNVSKFDQDVLRNQGYLYTTNEKLSSRMANLRLTESVLELCDLRGKRVIDLGCGDGTYTLEWAKRKPSYLLGVDAAKLAVQSAKKKARGLKFVEFRVMDIYKVHSLKGKFDIAIVRGLLHHLADPQKAIAAISKIAKEVIVVEPNGYNPVLKVIEKVSPYHVTHEEKSYSASLLGEWFEGNGMKIREGHFRGLVPMFCPDWIAKTCKAFEPIVERVPLLRHLACAVYVFKAAAN